MKETQPTVEDTIKSNEKLSTLNDVVEGKTPSLSEKLTKLKNDGNDIFKEKKYDEAIKIYKQGIELYEKESQKNDEENLLYKKLLANIALSYYKQNKFDDSIQYDLKILQLDPKYDRSVIRLFKAYDKLNKQSQALSYAEIFEKFDEATKKKYKNIDKEISNVKNKSQKKQNREKENNKNTSMKLVIPVVVLLVAVVLFFVFKKGK